jgi:hypothetical protein
MDDCSMAPTWLRHRRDTDYRRGDRGYLWFALALLAVLLGSSAKVALHGLESPDAEARANTASLNSHDSK